MASLASHLVISSSSLFISSPSSWKGRIPAKIAFPSTCKSVHWQPRRPCVQSSMEIPDYLPLDWTKTKERKPVGPRLDLTAEEAVLCQLEALKNNDWPYHEHGIEVMYRFSGFDPFKLSKYFGQSLDLGQFDKFKRIFHHSSHRVMLGHNDTKVLSSLYLSEHFFKQRVCIQGAHPDDEGIFEITMIQRMNEDNYIEKRRWRLATRVLVNWTKVLNDMVMQPSSSEAIWKSKRKSGVLGMAIG